MGRGRARRCIEGYPAGRLVERARLSSVPKLIAAVYRNIYFFVLIPQR